MTERPVSSAPHLPREAARAVDQFGTSLTDLSRTSPVLVLFLRHTGCTFCREALAELASRREALTEAGIVPAIVHLQAADEPVRELLERYGLADVSRFGDPQQALYAAFGLARGGLGNILGPKVWWRGFETTVLRGHLPGKPSGDIRQLPGAFLVHDGQILGEFRAETSADEVPWDELSSCSTGFCRPPSANETPPAPSTEP